MTSSLSRARGLRPAVPRLAVAAIALMMLASPQSASADVDRALFYWDGDDTSQEMDIRLAGLVTRNDPRRYTMTIRTFETIQMPEDGDLWVQLDTFGSPRWDYDLHIWFDMSIYCDVHARIGDRVPDLLGWDVSGRLARCQFHQLPKHDKPIRFRAWSAGWYVTDPGVIVDRAPAGWYP